MDNLLAIEQSRITHNKLPPISSLTGLKSSNSQLRIAKYHPTKSSGKE
jgi:hypothetical protein